MDRTKQENIFYVEGTVSNVIFWKHQGLSGFISPYDALIPVGWKHIQRDFMKIESENYTEKNHFENCEYFKSFTHTFIYLIYNRWKR